MTEEEEDDEKKIVNLRGIAIISTFIVSSVMYIQSSELVHSN